MGYGIGKALQIPESRRTPNNCRGYIAWHENGGIRIFGPEYRGVPSQQSAGTSFAYKNVDAEY